jgi:hypothetical protein
LADEHVVFSNTAVFFKILFWKDECL